MAVRRQTKIVCNIRKLKPGTIKVEHVIAENAIAYIVKELKFRSPQKSAGRGDRSNRNRGVTKGFGQGGILQFENPLLLLDNDVEVSGKTAKKNKGTKKEDFEVQ